MRVRGFPVLLLSVLVPFIVLPVISCRTPQVMLERAVTEIEWLQDGFRLHSPSRTFRYRNKAGAETGELTVLDDYRETFVYIDRGLDGTVNELHVDARGDGAQRSYRGAVGQEGLFETADAVYARHSEDLNVRKFVDRWKGAGPGGFAKLEAVGGH